MADNSKNYTPPRVSASAVPDRQTSRRDNLRGAFGVSLDDVISDMRVEIESAVDFLQSEFGDDWEQASKYYAGETNLPSEEGRSQVIKTVVRDTVRALKPSILRVLLHSRKPVEYVPEMVGGAALAEQQSVFVTEQFWKQGGYKLMHNVIDECLLKKGAFVKTYWEEDPLPVFSEGTGLTQEAISALETNENVEIEEMTVSPASGALSLPTYDVKWRTYYPNGRICMDAVPTYEAFFSRNMDELGDRGVHGHRREVTVAEAIEMGLECDDWRALDTEDPEQSRHASESKYRRGYQKNDEDDLQSRDLAQFRILLTECYKMCDMDGTGRPKKYVFWLGGTSYKYLDHAEVEDWELDCIQTDPVAFTVLGHSIPDLVANDQDTSTALLRTIFDNAMMANNPRPVANPMLVDFNDLMNNRIGSPIKSKMGGVVDWAVTPFTGGQLLPLFQQLEMNTQDKTGVTKASQGLDPDALQSTDKEAVKNTIMMAQGQTELFVRNLVEGLIPVFAKLLRLSIRHMDPIQTIHSRGQIIPVAPAMFNPNLFAKASVGLGSAEPEAKMAALHFTLAKQEQILKEYGFDNPFTSLSQMYNTIEDMTELAGLNDVGRYFTVVTPEIEQQLAQQRIEAEQANQEAMAANAPMDPSKALVMIEGGKSKVREAEAAAKGALEASKLQLAAIKAEEEVDLKRDQMVQDRVLELLKIEGEKQQQKFDEQIRREQSRNERRQMLPSGGAGNSSLPRAGAPPAEAEA